VDISARKQAEDAVAASEERFRSLFEHAPIGLVIEDTHGQILLANRAMQRILGYDAEALRGMTFMQLTHPDEIASNWTLFEDALASRRDTYTIDKRYIHKDGHVVWAHIAVSVTRDPTGTPRSIIGMVLDMTDRHTAEERLRHSEAQYRRLVELAQEGIWQIDVEHRTVYVNEKMADLLGYSTAELLGRPVTDFLDEHERAVAAAQIEHTRQGAPADFDVRLLGKDGREVWVHVTASAFFDQQGAYAGGMAMVTDIGMRKEEEWALEQAKAAAEELASVRQQQVEEAQAMSAVSSALATTLEPGRLYHVILEQAERILHCDHTCVLLYEDGWATLVASRGVAVQPDGMRAFPVEAIESVMAYGRNGRPALIADTAAIRWIDVPPLVGPFAIRSSILVPLVLDGNVVGTFNVDSFTPNYYTEKHLARAIALGERVTQALRNARLFQLEQQRARTAEELARLKEDFVASVTHELRTPLTAILGYAEILEARWTRLDDAWRMEQIHKIVLAANRQQRVVGDLLMLSSLERRALAPAPTLVRLADLLRQARDEVQATYRDQRVEFDEGSDIQVLADPGRALQVLVNLLDNAAKYSPVGTPVVVTCSIEEGMGVVRVRDCGPGVPEHGRERLFTRFGRMGGSRTRSGRVGTGLGLYISRRLVEEMSGALDLEATGLAGSTFRLRLPAPPA
jgi:PAS domain S-box-containing protein